MGLFDFIKDIGIGKKDDKEENLEKSLMDAIQKANLGIQDFTLQLSKGVATISGTATSLKDSEIARLIVGNHRGVEKVNDDGLKVVPTTPTPLLHPDAQAAKPSPTASASVASTQVNVAAKMVTVKSGDTLSKIAKEQLGNANRYPEIFEANKPMLKDPDEIFPGQILRIPSDAASMAAH